MEIIWILIGAVIVLILVLSMFVGFNKILEWLHLKKKRRIPYDERVVKFLHQQYVAECDVERMNRFLADLDAWGLKYHFRSNISDGMKVKGTKVIDGDEEKDKKYAIIVWGTNRTKALKSPAYWNSITDQEGGLVHPSVLDVGVATWQGGEAVSRMFDQISLMWGHSFIERSGLLTSPRFEGKQIYTKYTFGLVEDGCTHGTEPVIVLESQIFGF
jgi:hypothetical protein